MSKDKSKVAEKTQEAPQEQEQLKLDDARRVKVLSPGMLVFKRFIRNKLAVAGIIILAVMFVFSFLGPLFSPYKRAQIFTKDVQEPGAYATGKFNEESRFLGENSSSLKSGALKVLGSTKVAGGYSLTEGELLPFSAGGKQYSLKVVNPDPKRPSCVILGTKHVATYAQGEVSIVEGESVDDALKAAILANAEAGGRETEFDYNGTTVSIEISKIERKYFLPDDNPVAVSTYNIYTPLRGKVADLQSDSEFLHMVSTAVNSGENAIAYDGKNFTLTGDIDNGFLLTMEDGTELFNITRDYHTAMIRVDVQEEGKEPESKEVDFATQVSDIEAFKEAVKTAIAEEQTSFSFDEQDYTVDRTETEYHVIMPDGQPAMTIANSFDPVESKYDALSEDFKFVTTVEQAIADGAASVDYDGETFALEAGNGEYTIKNAAGDEVVLASDIAYGPAEKGIELTVDFIKKLQEAMRSQQLAFTFVNQYGDETDATINLVNGNYYVDTMQKTSLIDARSPVSSKHWLGTDVNGMDVFTRLMYGGRVSLLVGFVVVIFEIVIGVIVGGISGYFGGVVDTILMRFVELFNAIPFYPMLIILGSVMDNLHTDATTRLMLTMVILGILGWTGIARIVRGQILSLREQDFMIATEATGIRTSRRIFRHLIPNVMPLLIVNATAGLGSVILTEATLGFLGLGVKYPMASWGSIINQVNDMQVMRTAWWIWIPAGLLILLTVLGFNFVGDGLRDAFDPKMKR